MRVRAALAGEPGRGVAGRRAGALADLVVLRVARAAAVVDAADHHRPVDVAVDEVDQHFAADPRHRHRAPVGAGHRRQRGGDPHPGAGSVVGRCAAVAVRGRMRQPAVALLTALPVELHLDAVVAVGVDHRAGRADHDRGLLAAHGRFRMQQQAVAVGVAAAVGHLAADGVNAVAVQRPLALACADRVQAAALFARDRLRQRAHAQRLRGRVPDVGAEVVVRQVHHARDDEAAFAGVAGVEQRLAVQREAGAGAKRAHGAGAGEHFAARLQRLGLPLGDALAVLARAVGVGAGGVAADRRRRVGVDAGGRRRPRAVAAVVPAGEVDAAGGPAQLAAPAVDDVLLHHRSRLGEAHRGLGVGLEAAVVVGDHHAVAAQAGAGGVAAVLEVIEQPFLAHQPLGESQVRFLVLAGQRAPGVEGAVGQVVAPLRHQLAGVLPAAEHGVEDVEHGLVLEHPAVAPGGQEGVPGADGQFVARQAAVGAQHAQRRHMAVEGPQLVAAGRRHQFQQHRLAQQRLQRDRRVAGQGGHRQLVGLAQGFLAAQAFGHQGVRAQRRGQPENTVVLGQTVWQRKHGFQPFKITTELVNYYDLSGITPELAQLGKSDTIEIGLYWPRSSWSNCSAGIGRANR